MRFAEDSEALYHDGLASLDNGEKLDKAVRKDGDEDKEPTGCPKCPFKPFGKRWMSCGFELVKEYLLAHEPACRPGYCCSRQFLYKMFMARGSVCLSTLYT